MQSATLFRKEGWGDFYLLIVLDTACRVPIKTYFLFPKPLED